MKTIQNKLRLSVLSVVILILSYFLTTFMEYKEDVKERALNMPEKGCYTWQDIEVVVFGEIQQ